MTTAVVAVIAFVAGAWFGALVIALCVAAKDGDRACGSR